MGNFGVGVASRSVTPTAGLLQAGKIFLWGYGEDYYPVRMTPSSVVLDPLLARAIVIRDGNGSELAIVAVDMGSLESSLTQGVRSRVQSSRGIAPHAVCLNVSHTHSAPAISTIPTWWHGPAGGFDQPDPQYRSYVENQIVAVIEAAYDAIAPADIAFGRGTSTINYNRFSAVPQSDRTLDVVRVTDDQGNMVAVLAAYPCHPTSLYDVTVISGDFPAAARQHVEAQWGGTMLFLQGFAGTVNPHTDPAIGLEMAKVGELFAQDIGTILSGPMSLLAGDVEVRTSTIAAPLKPIPPGAIAQAAASSGFRQRWATHMTTLGSAVPDRLPIQLQYLRIGASPDEWHILACAHEVATDLSATIRGLAGAPRATTLGYTNIQLSYLPSQAVLQNPTCTNFPFCGNYEGGSSFALYAHRGPLTDDINDRLVRGFLNLIQDWQARHGLNQGQYQETFDELTGSGYKPIDVCGYADVDGRSLFTGIWQRGPAPSWVARHGITPDEFQAEFTSLAPVGYRPVVVGGFNTGGQVRFAGIWEQTDGPPWVARHGLTSNEYQAQFDELTADGYRPIVVSGYEDGGQVRYAAIWDQRDTGPWVARHDLTESEYQQAITDFGAQGYRPTWLNGFSVGGQDLYAAVWEQDASAWVARHRLTPDEYQEAFDDLLGQGYRLQHACGYLVQGSMRYAALWIKS